MIIQGDCIEEMKKLPENSIDAIVTDPPYGLEFMGKDWDRLSGKGRYQKGGIWQNVEGYSPPAYKGGIEAQQFHFLWAKECLRILKPGGHLLSFGGSRTYHRMACAIEDAGFEIRDQIMWLYGSGFPKSLNISLNMSKQIDKFISNENIDNIWKNKTIRNVCDVEKVLLKDILNQEMGLVKENSVQDIVVENTIPIIKQKNALIVEKKLQDQNRCLKEEYFVIENVEQNIQQQKQNVKCVEKISLKRIVKSNNQNIFIVEVNVKDLLKESLMEIIKEEEAQKIWLGKWLYSKEMDINANFVELIENLKHIILKELKNIQNCDTNFQMESLIATNVIITKSIMECLILNMADILKEIIKNNYEGQGTALKPANEPIVVARKPLSEKNVALNVLKWGTGGINIDGCRIGTEERTYSGGNKLMEERPWNINQVDKPKFIVIGRFPANLILDEEAGRLLDKQSGISKSRTGKPRGTYKKGLFANSKFNKVGTEHNDKGGASRFFYCAKSSKRERNKGLEGFEDKAQDIGKLGINKPEGRIKRGRNPTNTITKNNHPTVKPIKLMRYLVRLVTPPNGTVLDPFMGSGTTGIACKLEGFKFIGIEKETEYIKIAEARINTYKIQPKLNKYTKTETMVKI